MEIGNRWLRIEPNRRQLFGVLWVQREEPELSQALLFLSLSLWIGFARKDVLSAVRINRDYSPLPIPLLEISVIDPPSQQHMQVNTFRDALVRESIANPYMDFQKSTNIDMDIHDFRMSVFNYAYKRGYPHWYPSTDIHARTFRNGYP